MGQGEGSGQFSVLSSQFSVLSSQFSVLGSRFSVFGFRLAVGLDEPRNARKGMAVVAGWGEPSAGVMTSLGLLWSTVQAARVMDQWCPAGGERGLRST